MIVKDTLILTRICIDHAMMCAQNILFDCRRLFPLHQCIRKFLCHCRKQGGWNGNKITPIYHIRSGLLLYHPKFILCIAEAWYFYKCRHGIHEDSNDGFGHHIFNVTVRDHDKKGISLSGMNHHIKNCKSLNNGDDGITIGDAGSVTDCISYQNKNGIYAYSGCIITGNICYSNTNHGIFGFSGSLIVGNSCYDNTMNGIHASGSLVVKDNASYHNSWHGIESFDGSVVSNNVCSTNTQSGIKANGASTVKGNTCILNGSHGIDPIGRSLVIDNTTISNLPANIDSCTDCLFDRNSD